jgi:hypothetical protein
LENREEILDNNVLSTFYLIEEQKIINVKKFIFLSIITFGLYEIWWIYKAWRFFQNKEGSPIKPALRTIFSFIFLYSLLMKIQIFADEKGYRKQYSSILLFIGFVFFNMLSQLPYPYWFISFLSIVFLVQPFKALNFAMSNSTEFLVKDSTSFNTKQVVLIIFGIIFWALVILGLTIGENNM